MDASSLAISFNWPAMALACAGVAPIIICFSMSIIFFNMAALSVAALLAKTLVDGMARILAKASCMSLSRLAWA